jgi:hypothetical protein
VSRIDDIVAGVVAALNGAPAGTFALPFTAQDADLPLHDLAELNAVTVTVVPSAETSELETRTSSRHEITVDIGVQKHLAKGDSTAQQPEIRALRSLVEAIGKRLERLRLPAPANGAWLKTENRPIYSQEHLLKMSVFTSVLHVTYRA